MSQPNEYVVIMAGGGGTRLWPLSRQKKPKQFLQLTGETTLLQDMYSYVRRLLPAERILVMADAAKAELAREQLPEVPSENILIEPSSRDNGPAIALATLLLELRDPGCKTAIIWSDHSIQKADKFASCMRAAFDVLDAKPDHLVTIGLKPTRPATEFGYIKSSDQLGVVSNEPVFNVEGFEEKPNLETATRYVANEKYLWNSGYKIFLASTLLDLFREHNPGFTDILDQIKDRLLESPTASLADLWEQLERKDIERLITEKISQILVIPADLGWSDIGSWDILYNILKERDQVDLVSKAEHIDVGSTNSLVISDHRLIATAGLDNIAIIDTPDALLVINKDQAQDVKKLVEQLKETKSNLL